MRLSADDQLARFIRTAPHRQARRHQFGGDGIEFRFGILLGLFHLGLNVCQRAATQALRQIIARLGNGRRGQALRQVDDAVFHRAVFTDQNHQSPIMIQPDKFDLPQGGIDFLSDHHASRPRET